MIEVNIVLHIGAQRTGSTFLQKCVFRNIDFYKNNIFFISNENIWTNIWDIYDDRWGRLEILKNCMPKAKIIFGRRKKEMFKKSLYGKYITMGGTRHYRDFNTMINTKKLDFDAYISQLKEGFDEVFIYRHEDLIEQRKRVVQDICKFIGVTEPDYHIKTYNAGYGKYMLPIARNINKLFKNDFNPQGHIPCHYLLLPHRVLYQEIIMPHIKIKRRRMTQT